MKQLLLYFLISCISIAGSSQSTKTELYDLIKKMVTDSTGYENVGDWDATPKFPVKWSSDRIEMSDDTSINFFRRGTANIAIRNRSLMQAGQPVRWNMMLKGPRMGYTSFSIISSTTNELQPKYTIDSIFGKKAFTARLIKKCDDKTFAGYYYYEVKLPKKDVVYIKVSWISLNSNTAIRIDSYTHWTNYAAKLDCPK